MVKAPCAFSFGFALRGASFALLGCNAQSAPPLPSNLRCPDPGMILNALPGQLIAQVDVDPISVDMVSFMAARADDPEKWPFVQYSVSVGVTDAVTVSGNIPGLTAGIEYLLMARAHTRNQTTAYFIYWSEVAHMEVPCKAAGSYGTAIPAPTAPAGSATDTMWMEVFRYNGNGLGHGIDPRNNITLPDYIEGHNTADFKAAFSQRWSVMYDAELHFNASFTRYCIEMQVVELHNVTTPTDWVPATSQFADYNPCTAGQCYCMSRIDREVCQQPLEQIVAVCGNPEPDHEPGHPDHDGNSSLPCDCPAERQRDSQKHIGRVRRFANGGSWYSMPPGGYCAPGASIGDAGCTYRPSPLSHSVSVNNLYSSGVFNEYQWWSYSWLENARAAFDNLGVEPCGQEQIMI